MKIHFEKSLKKKAESVTEIDLGYHKLSLEQLSRMFKVSLTNGLSSETAAALLLKNGKNKIFHQKPNLFLKILKYFFTGFCGLIWIAAIICILAWKPIGNPPDSINLGLGIMLIIVIFLQAAFTAFQDWSSNKVMKSIKNMIPSSATVIRDGIEHKILSADLVIGDLVVLSYGTKVPADIRLIESHDLKFDKSMLTGESESVEGLIECTDERYIESKNVAFMSTLITNGQGKGIVVATGDKTMIGKIAGLSYQTVEKETTLQKELKRFVKIISAAALIMAIIVVIVWAAWLRVNYPTYIDLPSLLVNTISVIVAFIPEGLPVCVTLSLLLIAKRMAKSRVLVKNLSTIETLSCVNVIASDKTGTLTQNKMFVAKAAVGLENINLLDLKHNKHEKTSGFNQLIACCSLCNNAAYEAKDERVDINNRNATGDATDIALLKFSTEFQMFSNLDEKYTLLSEIPFNSKNKWMMKTFRPNEREGHESIFGKGDDENSDLMLLKGAPDYLLKKCRYIIDQNGAEVNLTNQNVVDFIQLQNDWCMMGQRVLLLCKKKVSYSESENNLALSPPEMEALVNKFNDFCIIGLVGINDPPREGIQDVVEKCRGAGIRVFMVTGDYALTAAAIALQIGIFTAVQYDTAELMRIKHKINHEPYEKSALLLTGNDLEHFSPDDWRLVTHYEQIVFARTTPEQKLKIVKEFQVDDYVVGVTGDGVNDAPALKCADIGIAMGGGSEVAMEAAQLILLDNNFSSILVAIRNGRLVYFNLKKVILYLLPGGCMAELAPMLMTIFLGVPQNLSSFQMLIISLFTDIAPSLSLIMEHPEKELLNQPPRSKRDHIVDWKFILHAYVFLGGLIVLFSQCMFFWYMEWFSHFTPLDIIFSFGWQDGFKHLTLNQINEFYYTGQTVTFISIVYLQIFGNLLSTRTNVKSFFKQSPWKKSTRNLWIFAAEFISIVILLFIIYVPFCNAIFNTRPPPVQFFFIPLIFCFILFLADELRKFFVRRKFCYFDKFGW